MARESATPGNHHRKFTDSEGLGRKGCKCGCKCSSGYSPFVWPKAASHICSDGAAIIVLIYVQLPAHIVSNFYLYV